MRIAILTTAALSSGIALAATPIDGWYAAAFGGYTFLPDNLAITHLGLARNHANYKSGFNAGGQLGFKTNPLRYEIEGTYLQSKVESFRINTIRQRNISGKTGATLFMANLYYDFPDMVPGVQPYVGIGLGYGHLQASFGGQGPFFQSWFERSANVFAYQAMAGFVYSFSETYACTIAYRYVGTDRAKNLGKVFQADLGVVGVVYRFNAANYK